MLIMSLQMVSRRDLIDSVTEFEDKVRHMKQSIAPLNVLRCDLAITWGISF